MFLKHLVSENGTHDASVVYNQENSNIVCILLLCTPRYWYVHMHAGAGADFVMLGGMFAGHDQSGGEIVEKDGKKFKTFYGMSSSTAMEKYHGGVKEYR